MGKKSDSMRPVARMRRPSWKDPKLLVGMTLILVSILAVVSIVRISDRTEPFYIAKRDIAVGEELSPEDFKISKLQLGSAAAKYWSTEQELAQGAVAVAPLAQGELVAHSAVGQRDRLDRKPMTLTVPAGTVAGIQQGRPVDVWVAPKSKRGTGYEDPRLTVSEAEVSRISREENALGASDEVTVQVLVLEEELPELIKAASSDARLTLIPTYGG